MTELSLNDYVNEEVVQVVDMLKDDVIKKLNDELLLHSPINKDNTDIELAEITNRYNLLNDEHLNLKKLFDNYKENIQEQQTKHENELKQLHERLNEKEKEIASLESKLVENEQLKRVTIDQLHADFKVKLEQAFKKFQETQKDKTTIVMKYAEAEKKCIDLNRLNEHLQAKYNDSVKEKQRLNEKFELKQQEKVKLNAEYELKLNELGQLKKQMEKLKEQNLLNETKLSNLESKYKNEHELNMKNRILIDSLNVELIKHKNNQNSSIDETIKVEEVIQQQQLVEKTNDENTSSIVASSIVFTGNTRIVDSLDYELKYSKLQREYQQVQAKAKSLNDELTQLKAKLISVENENKANAIMIQNCKDTLNNQKQMNKDLLSEVLQLRELQVTLNKEQQEKKVLEAKVETLTVDLNESNQEMQTFKQKQCENLEFTAKLTEKNTKLQSENFVLSEKLLNLTNDLENINSLMIKTDESNKLTSTSLSDKLSDKIKENELLTLKYNEKSKLADELSTKLNDIQDENVSLKKKHAANIKDLTNQLQKLYKQLEIQTKLIKAPQIQNQANLSPNEQQQLIRFNNSRSNSISSLDKEDLKSINGSISSSGGELNNNHNTTLCNNINNNSSVIYNENFVNNNNNNNSQTTSTNGSVNIDHADVYVVDIDKQKIIDKVVKLQKTLAKKTEKIDFLQDHVNQLTLDVQKKTRIIQAYAMKEDVGVFTSDAHDANKREMSRKTGIMAALYNNHNISHSNGLIPLNGNHMTMDLCLEINSKLQALLEDTLIKNITLKENLETLGHEIARLSQENRQIKMKLP